MTRTEQPINRRRFVASAVAGAAGVTAGRMEAADREPSKSLRAGAAAVDITPPLGVSLSGPISKRGPARRIVTPLHARALVLDNGSRRIAFVVCDATIIYDQVAEKAKRLVYQRTGLPAEHVVLSATHSHAVPRVGMETSKLDVQYYDLFCRRVAECVARAVENLAPAKIGWGTGSKPEFARCRRILMKPGSLGPNPFGEFTDQAKMGGGKGAIGPTGPTDPQVGVLSVRHRDGRPLAVMASYSIHYVSGDKRGDVTADYFGHFASQMATLVRAEKADPPFVAIMANGNSGDTSSYHGGYEGMKKVGHALADEVLRVSRQIDYHDHVPLVARQSSIQLDVRRPDAKRIEWAQAVLAGKWRGEAHHWKKIYAQQTLELARFNPTIPVRLQAFRVGRLGITTVPCEMFASTGLAIRDKSPLRPCFNIELANGYRGYLPPPDQHKLGGYTTWPATSSCLEVEAEPKIRRELLRLLGEVARSAPG